MPSESVRVNVGISAEQPVCRREYELVASLRLITVYDAMTDGAITRFDVLINGKDNERGVTVEGFQLNCVLQSTSPQGGNKRYGELIIPAGPGIFGAFAVMLEPHDLADMMHGLADKIEDAVRVAVLATNERR